MSTKAVIHQDDVDFSSCQSIVQWSHGSIIQETLPESWRQGIKESRFLTNPDPTLNKFVAKCGGSLIMWESGGWISEVDPCDWFQWYVASFKVEERPTMLGKSNVGWAWRGPKEDPSHSCAKSSLPPKLAWGIRTSTSPVICQTMWHWGWNSLMTSLRNIARK